MGEAGSIARPSFYQDVMVVLSVAWIARLIFILFMPFHARSFDAIVWETVANDLKAGQNPYQTTVFLNWPPFWLQIIFILSKVSTLFSIPFFRVLQVCCILFESVVIVSLVRLIREVVPGAPVRALVILGISLNPAAILLVCQHCNFDVIVGMWVMLFMLSMLRYNRSKNEVDWLVACLFLGLGVLTKTVPLILFPMLAGGFRKTITSAKFLGPVLFLGPVTLGMSIVFVLSPAEVTANVLGYRSMGGFFGVSGLFHMAGADQFIPLYNVFFYILLAAFTAAISVFFWLRGSMGDRETVLLAMLILATVPALGPGYGPQYLYWYLPMLVATYAFYQGRWRVVLASFGLILALTYLVEYALVGSDGMYLLKILAANMSTLKQAVELLPTIQKCESPVGSTLIRLPLFGAFLVMLGTGYAILFKRIKRDSKEDC